MHLAVRVLLAAMIPSIAAAQSDARSSTPATQHVSSGLGISGAVTFDDPPRAQELPTRPTPPRLLVVDCPAQPATSSDGTPKTGSVADSLDTSGLVAALCARAAAAPTPMAPLVVQQGARPAATPHAEQHHEPEPGAPALPVEPQLSIHLFADVRFSATDSLGSKNGFSLGQFDLFAHSELSDNLSVLTEATLTALPKNTFNTKLERLLLTFSPSNHFSAAVGRFHTGVGYYNAAYHHGTWFQTAVGRPLVFAIDGDIGVVPIHTLGVSTTGEIPSGALGLRYVAEVGSGRAGQSSAAAAPQPSLSDNNTPAFNLALIARPEHVDGLQLGVSLYRDRLTLTDTTKAGIDETIGAAHALYKTDAVELLGEMLVFKRSPRSTLPAVTSRGYYAQASRRVGPVRPYVRVDYLDIPRTDPLFGFLGRRAGPTFGARYDFEAFAALKLQASHLNQTTRSTMNRFDAQVAFMF
jgi:hypothetical protein